MKLFDRFKKKKEAAPVESKPQPDTIVNDAGLKVPVKYLGEYFGLKHYTCVDQNNLPSKRALAALPKYQEMRMKTTYELYVATLTAIEDLCTIKPGTESVSISQLLANDLEIIKICKAEKERASYLYEPLTLMGLAGILIWDENESPYEYDALYANIKAKRWVESEERAFFFDMALAELIPSSTDSNASFQTYGTLIMHSARLAWENVMEVLSRNRKNAAHVAYIKSQISILEKLTGWNEKAFGNTAVTSASSSSGTTKKASAAKSQKANTETANG